ncbi:hypothetical protein BDD43_3605 [Mucilaginibacter gracilis]|uniref:Uncharacterized protein n=1 Tax=Mucilaginibacter gracilis TaxID=423350 RepID=A0A495J384_9SPHI|nr:hypothetical protein [Mucilaginibacter gracilis]RKR83397.1 hypothetical protein BDD43_3605 [Mucilaginibacter gracilis]
MRNPKTITDLKGRKFNGTSLPKIKRIRQEPRQKILQLLISFVPLEKFQSNEKTVDKSANSGTAF